MFVSGSSPVDMSRSARARGLKLESMACGCALVAPPQPVDLQYFKYEGAYQCAQMIRKALERPVVSYPHGHEMENRFDQIFQKVGVCVS